MGWASAIWAIFKAIAVFLGWRRDQALRADGARQVAEEIRGKTELIRKDIHERDKKPLPPLDDTLGRL